MKPFIHDDFLLETQTARELYHHHAKHLPIIDYHCHLSPEDIANNRQFNNLFECWLEGDHYKWRAMRANGIGEHLITGNSSSPREKFEAWACTVPMTYRNPLYHWTHLELARHFGITDLLDESSSESIWQQTAAKLPDLSVQAILSIMRVEIVCTTDDPTDALTHHQAFRSAGIPVRMLPTFRPDKAMQTDDLQAWNAWVDKLASVSNSRITDFQDFLAALKTRHDFFHEMGGRLSDHGLNYCPATAGSDAELAEIFLKARTGKALLANESEQLAARILLETARWNYEKNWTFQLHLGAQRNNNTRASRALGKDSGFDSIGDWQQTERLARLLDSLDREDRLPRTILYNLNPADNYAFATLAGNFNDGSIPGKIQFGSGWWFLDQKEGMEWQINALSHLGLLSRFVGMLTDSRSFLSFPRHEYFRRILCNLLGRDVERGEIPNDSKRLARYVEGICHRNARDYLAF